MLAEIFGVRVTNKETKIRERDKMRERKREQNKLKN